MFSSTVAFSDTLSFLSFFFCANCARTLYAIGLRTLQAHGLTGHDLETVFKATVQARLLYCSPAWSVYCTAADRDRLELFLRRCKRPGYCDVNTQSVVELFQLAGEAFFERVLNDDQHVLQLRGLNTATTSDTDDMTTNLLQ